MVNVCQFHVDLALNDTPYIPTLLLGSSLATAFLGSMLEDLNLDSVANYVLVINTKLPSVTSPTDASN